MGSQPETAVRIWTRSVSDRPGETLPGAFLQVGWFLPTLQLGVVGAAQTRRPSGVGRTPLVVSASPGVLAIRVSILKSLLEAEAARFTFSPGLPSPPALSSSPFACSFAGFAGFAPQRGPVCGGRQAVSAKLQLRGADGAQLRPETVPRAGRTATCPGQVLETPGARLRRHLRLMSPCQLTAELKRLLLFFSSFSFF